MGNIYAPQRQTNKKQRDISPLLHKNLLYPTCNNYRPHGLFFILQIVYRYSQRFFPIDDTKIQSNAVFFLVEILHLFEEYLQNNVIGRFFHFLRLFFILHAVLTRRTAIHSFEGMRKSTCINKSAHRCNLGDCFIRISDEHLRSSLHLNGGDKHFRAFARCLSQSATKSLLAHIESRRYMRHIIITGFQTIMHSINNKSQKIIPC